MTWVRPPLARFPPSGQYLYNYLKTKATDSLSRLGLWFSSKPGFFKPAQFKPNNKKLVPTAKALHRAMYEAVANGDKAALRQVCANALSSRFSMAIDARPPGRKYSWELLRYNKRIWLYPRVVNHKVVPLPADPSRPTLRRPILRQVTVAIASRQRRVEYVDSKDGGRGQPVPGSEKEVDVVENMVMSCQVDRDTFVQTPWRIVGMVGEMTLEKFREEKQILDDMEAYEAAKKMQ